MTDKFGNNIEVGDYVIFSLDVRGRHGKLFRGRVKEIKGKSLSLYCEDTGCNCYAYPECFVRDNSDLVKKYADSDIFLDCLKACGVDNWDGYGLAQEMYEGEEC